MNLLCVCVCGSDFCFRMDKVLKRCVFDCFDDATQTKMLPLRPADACKDEETHYEVARGYVKAENNSIASVLAYRPTCQLPQN